MLRNGEGFTKDEKKGLELQGVAYKALKDAKDPYSITATAIMIFQGKVAGQNIDENERRRIAAGLYKQAADMGFAPAQFNYAMALNDGHGVEKDSVLFDKYINAAIETGYPLANNFEIKTKSSHKGGNSDGRWAYEFINLRDINHKKCRISIQSTKEIIYSDDQYIVEKQLFNTGDRFGYSTHLLLKDVVTIPNNVCSIDFSPQRGQFIILTVSRNGDGPWVKFPKDTGQALVLIDLHRGNLERVPVWKFDEAEPGWGGELYWAGGPNFSPRWNGNNIVLDKSKFSSEFDPYLLGEMLFTNDVFQDVRVVVKKKFLKLTRVMIHHFLAYHQVTNTRINFLYCLLLIREI